MTNKTKLLITACLALVLGGCEQSIPEVQKNWQTFDGSKTDATVTLAYQYGGNVIPITSASQGQNIAVKACQAWGYQSARVFSATKKTCLNRSYYTYRGNTIEYCTRQRVTQNYQCGYGQESKASTPNKLTQKDFPIN